MFGFCASSTQKVENIRAATDVHNGSLILLSFCQNVYGSFSIPLVLQTYQIKIT